uniref:CBM1 domain-containing protein n=1 Tax=Chromera velia CCMP2878 TaxID=1169474 RepID=A0A0G4FJD6_9ALVE|eukprot:Cvel_17288.t1-p1 / transcript=Cvel_17288.t1 / gene=Cvel_17288 / organism=Chromera_velia_CCMP2878 / gene_product=hypothetical protein / transcript_product=hypothetical protein / location=Cvel_scaffold1372:4464-4821(-) / protein_length=83 / sequence_SO=supercontig / SO=protein_coding / is_pseudo=false
MKFIATALFCVVLLFTPGSSLQLKPSAKSVRPSTETQMLETGTKQERNNVDEHGFSDCDTDNDCAGHNPAQYCNQLVGWCRVK